jgi:hypothetical protein
MAKIKELKGIELIEDILKSDDPGYMKMQAKQYLLGIELQKSFGNFNIHEYLDMSSNRPVLKGVYHDNGYMVATDASLLVYIKKDYPEKNEGKIISPLTGEIIGKYPNWRGVIPSTNVGDVIYKFDEEAVKNVLATHSIEKKAKLFHKWLISIHGVFFNAKYIKKLMKVMKELKIDSVRFKVDYYGCVMKKRGLFNENENGGFVLMPDMHDPENYPDNDVKIFYL